jgi:hypothetical protein
MADAGRARMTAISGHTVSRAGGITSLYHEILDHAIKNDIVVVAFHAQLYKVAHGLGRFFGLSANIASMNVIQKA